MRIGSEVEDTRDDTDPGMTQMQTRSALTGDSDERLADITIDVPAVASNHRQLLACLTDIVKHYGTPTGPLVSLVLFGSASTGGYTGSISDVDLLIVLADDADVSTRQQVYRGVAELEGRHGQAKARVRPRWFLSRALAAFADRVTANVRAFFVCTRADLRSGEPARILGIPRAQACFVDRIAIPSIVASGVTVWGEQLLAAVPLPPIRRFDVGKAVCRAVWPGVGDRGRVPAGARRAESGAGTAPRVRRAYRPSYSFVIRCLPALVRLHWRTARHVRSAATRS